jgi:hypothetical protein
VPVRKLDDARRELGRGPILGRRLRQAILGRELVAAIHAQVGAIQDHEPPELGEGLRMVLDAQIEEAIRPRAAARRPPHDDERRRLAAADVAAGGFGGVERGEEALGEVALRLLERLRHRRPDALAPHEVRLHRESLARRVSREGDAALSGVRRHPALRVHHRHLADRGVRIR